MRLRNIAAIGLATLGMAGMTAVVAPQADASSKCFGNTTRVAHKAIKKGSTVIGYLDVYNTSRMVCAITTAKSKTGTQGIGVYLKDGLANSKDAPGNPEPSKKDWKNGWDAVSNSSKFRKSTKQASDYDNGEVFVWARLKKNGKWYYQGYTDKCSGYDTWSESKKTCI